MAVLYAMALQVPNRAEQWDFSIAQQPAWQAIAAWQLTR